MTTTDLPVAHDRLLAETPWRLAGLFLEALAERDFGALGALFDERIAFRALVPSGVVSHEDAAAAAATFRRWFGARRGYRLVDASVGQIGARTHLRYRITVAAGDDPAETEHVEQHAFFAAGERITGLDVMCSGFQREAGPTACRVAP